MIAGLLLCAVCSESHATPNARPQLSVGSAIPLHWGTIDRGVVYAGAVETEQSPRVSALFEFDYQKLRSNQIRWDDAKVFGWKIGARFHMVETGRVRPYAQLGLGMRIGDAGSSPYAIPA